MGKFKGGEIIMKINDSLNVNILNNYISDKLVKEGTLIEGKILDIIDDLAIIDVKGLGIVRAYTEKDLSEQIGKTLNFIVKTSLPNKLELGPISIKAETKEILEFTNKKEDYFKNVLKEFQIEDNNLSLEFLDSLIKYNVQINKKNLVNGIRIFEKLEQLINLNEDHVAITTNSKEENINIGKEDIRNFIIVDKAEGNDKTNLGQIERKDLVGFLDKRLDSEMIKTISFFIKYNIKPTLNNIKSFQLLKEDPELFSEDYKVLEEAIDKKFTIYDKKININNKGPKNIVEKSILKYKIILDKIINYTKENDIIKDKGIKKNIDELKNKIELLDEMNKELIFVCLPLKLEWDKYDGAITLLKKREKEKDTAGKISVFINLKTNRLGNINIYCEVLNKGINIKFGEIKEDDLILFKSNEDKLKTLVENTGYEIKSIEYSSDKNDNILDSLIINTKPIYYFDVKV